MAILLFIGIVVLILFVIEVVQFKRALKYGLVIDIISTIGTSMRQSLPLPTALAAAAYGQRKKHARIFNNIAYWLTQGCSLSEALRRGYPKCPTDILGPLTAAEKMDQLPEAVESLQADMAEKMPVQFTEDPYNFTYPLTVLTVAFLIMMGLSIFIIPTFAEVLSDMSDGREYLPAMTQSLLDFAKWLTGSNGLNALLVFLCVLLFVFFTISIRSRRRTPEKPRLLSRLGDRIKWYMPVSHWFEKTFGNLYLTQTLRTGLAAGHPINTVLRHVTSLDINLCYHNQIKKWLDKIESGDNITDSARACGLDKTLSWAFDDTINKGNTPKILEGLEELFRHKYNFRKNVLTAASIPFMVLGLGLAVGYVVLSMFLGIFSIITVTLQYTIPH